MTENETHIRREVPPKGNQLSMLVGLLHCAVPREPARRDPQFASPNNTQKIAWRGEINKKKARTEVNSPWGQAEADALLPNSRRHSRNYFEHEARTIFWGASILVRASLRN